MQQPQLIPERKVMADKLALLNDEPVTGLRMVRAGQEYIGRCPCGSKLSTSDPDLAFGWFDTHEREQAA